MASIQQDANKLYLYIPLTNHESFTTFEGFTWAGNYKQSPMDDQGCIKWRGTVYTDKTWVYLEVGGWSGHARAFFSSRMTATSSTWCVEYLENTVTAFVGVSTIFSVLPCGVNQEVVSMQDSGNIVAILFRSHPNWTIENMSLKKFDPKFLNLIELIWSYLNMI